MKLLRLHRLVSFQEFPTGTNCPVPRTISCLFAMEVAVWMPPGIPSHILPFATSSTVPRCIQCSFNRSSSLRSSRELRPSLVFSYCLLLNWPGYNWEDWFQCSRLRPTGQGHSILFQVHSVMFLSTMSLLVMNEQTAQAPLITSK